MEFSDTRIQSLNDRDILAGDYVLYWMQQSQRIEHNPALELAIREANCLELPVLVVFGLTDAYPDANWRHYQFMLEGLRDVKKGLFQKGIRFVLRLGEPSMFRYDAGASKWPGTCCCSAHSRSTHTREPAKSEHDCREPVRAPGAFL